MSVIAAIDIGSNALRCSIASVDPDGRPLQIDYSRRPVRLGDDVFTTGEISPSTMDALAEACRHFREMADQRMVKRLRVVATSALREASNREEVLARVESVSGLTIQVIEGAEEARLITRSVADKVDLRSRVAMLIDIGGGSTEVSVTDHGQIVATESFKMGTVRLLRMAESQAGTETPDAAIDLMRQYVAATHRFLLSITRRHRIGLCLGTGGTIETMGELRNTILGKRTTGLLTARDLDALLNLLMQLPLEERIRRLGLRPDKADVILPAAVILQYLLSRTGLKTVHIPRASLKDGLLLELAEEVTHARSMPLEQVYISLKTLGTKFGYDERHAAQVADLCGVLFDATRALHGCGPEERLLLHVAAVLHDIGQYVSLTDHHKHSLYLINALPIIGLSPTQRAVAANIARYHHKSLPRPRHESFAALSVADQERVRRMTPLLRLADALDFSHAGMVSSIRVVVEGGTLVLRIRGVKDTALALWAIRKHAMLLMETYKVAVKVAVEDEETADDAVAKT